MRFTVRQPAEDTPADVGDAIGRVIPLRIGSLAYCTVLERVELVDGGDVVLTFELPDSDLRWEALRAERFVTPDPFIAGPIGVGS